jgi:transposase-like protein
MYTEERLPTAVILRKHGINPQMLGSSRVRGIAQAIKKQYARFGSFSSVRRTGYGSQNVPPSERELQRLRTEVEYLKQERDFLKKILSAGKSGVSG